MVVTIGRPSGPAVLAITKNVKISVDLDPSAIGVRADIGRHGPWMAGSRPKAGISPPLNDLP